MDNFLITYKAFKNSSLIFVKSDVFHDTRLTLFAKGNETFPRTIYYKIKSSFPDLYGAYHQSVQNGATTQNER